MLRQTSSPTSCRRLSRASEEPHAAAARLLEGGGDPGAVGVRHELRSGRGLGRSAATTSSSQRVYRRARNPDGPFTNGEVEDEEIPGTESACRRGADLHRSAAAARPGLPGSPHDFLQRPLERESGGFTSRGMGAPASRRSRLRSLGSSIARLVLASYGARVCTETTLGPQVGGMVNAAPIGTIRRVLGRLSPMTSRQPIGRC
jgi:hypothetical protein